MTYFISPFYPQLGKKKLAATSRKPMFKILHLFLFLLSFFVFENNIHCFDDFHVTVLFTEHNNLMLRAFNAVEVVVMLLCKTIVPA